MGHITLSINKIVGRVEKIVMIALLLFFVAASSPFSKAYAAGCDATVDPHNPPDNSNTGFDFNVTENDFTIRWIKLSSPSSGVTITDASSWQWGTIQTSAAAVVFTDSTIDITPGTTSPLHVLTDIGQYFAPTNWIVQVSADGSGSNPVTCTGDLSISVSDTGPPVISSISAGATTTSATISWITNKPANSTVSFGTDSSYGSQQQNGDYVTSHNVMLNNLQPNTSYHYQVSSSDEASNTTTSDDNTFVTPKTIEGEDGNLPLTTKIPIKAVPTERVPPTIQLTTDISKSFKQVPTISGSATDNEALAGIEYSVDNGKDWLPVDKAPGLGTKKSDFSFTPQNLKDGNYQLLARAIDTSGNIGTTSAQTLVIDRLPPIVGGNVIYVGSQSLQPNAQGVITSLVGVDQKITMSSVGGATSITLTATTSSDSSKPKNFSLTKSSDSGLWSGILSFSKAGMYQLSAKAVDGAGNVTTRNLNIVHVTEPGKVTDAKSGKSTDARVSVYYRDTDTNSWVLWDGESYDQPNPTTTRKGIYDFYLPAGTYYLRFTAQDYQTIVTRSFTLDKPTAIGAAVKMHKKAGFTIGSLHVRLPSLTLQDTAINLASSASANKTTTVPSIPQFSLPKTNGGSLTNTNLFGKPTIITFVNTWAPSAQDQLATLSQMNTPSLNIFPVVSGENLTRAEAYMNQSGYGLPVVVDPDDQLAQALNITSLPTHYFLDRHGVVKKVMFGVLSNEELIKNVEL